MARAVKGTARKGRLDPNMLVPFSEDWMGYVADAIGKPPGRRTAHEVESFHLAKRISAAVGHRDALSHSTHALDIEAEDFEAMGKEDHDVIRRRLAEELPTVRLAEISLYNDHAYAYVRVADKDWNIETESRARSLVDEAIVEIRSRQQRTAGLR